MNLVSGFNTKKEIYNRELNLIEGIKFTYREIDIIACILHNRGVLFLVNSPHISSIQDREK